jgi:hypothetical protein
MLYILPTIDTEGVHGNDPFQNFALGKCDNGEYYGALKMAEIFSRYSISATFFIDVYENSLFGEEVLEDLCVQLKELKQDVQLHTHPGWRDDPCDFEHVRSLKTTNSYLSSSKDFMSKLSLEEQISILKDGVDLLKKWIGEKPIAHRSGGYSLNENTFTALKEVGIPVDSSMHYLHPNSQFVLSKSQIIEHNNIIELPVTLCNVVFWKYKKLLKTDLDTLNLKELLEYVDISLKSNNVLMNFFMHSYSLLSYDYYYTKLNPSFSQEKKLINFIEKTLSNNEVKWIDTRTFYDLYKANENTFLGTDDIPTISSLSLIGSLATKKILHKCQEILGHPSPQGI